MLRSLVTLVACSAAYGFTIGASNSPLYAARNLVKFPLLIVVTTVVCALSYFVLARFLGTPLSFLRVQRLVLAVFRDLSVLLASLGPVVLFLGLTMLRPSHGDLADYPMFQGLNVAFIALCGCLAVRRQGGLLLRDHGLPPGLRNALVAGWMLLSLFAGGQAAWYMRPFFGVDPPPPEGVDWFFGTAPDFRGARSIYEAVWNLAALPARR
jgi:hypothetical protein